jgi:hypothetical protein
MSEVFKIRIDGKVYSVSRLGMGKSPSQPRTVIAHNRLPRSPTPSPKSLSIQDVPSNLDIDGSAREAILKPLHPTNRPNLPTEGETKEKEGLVAVEQPSAEAGKSDPLIQLLDVIHKNDPQWTPLRRHLAAKTVGSFINLFKPRVTKKARIQRQDGSGIDQRMRLLIRNALFHGNHESIRRIGQSKRVGVSSHASSRHRKQS